VPPPTIDPKTLKPTVPVAQIAPPPPPKKEVDPMLGPQHLDNNNTEDQDTAKALDDKLDKGMPSTSIAQDKPKDPVPFAAVPTVDGANTPALPINPNSVDGVNTQTLPINNTNNTVADPTKNITDQKSTVPDPSIAKSLDDLKKRRFKNTKNERPIILALKMEVNSTAVEVYKRLSNMIDK